MFRFLFFQFLFPHSLGMFLYVFMFDLIALLFVFFIIIICILNFRCRYLSSIERIKKVALSILFFCYYQKTLEELSFGVSLWIK